jgi:uncharacterized Rmd1/YagE family protein
MSKSVVLALHESQIAVAFDQIEPLAAAIRRRGRGGRDASNLVRQIGEILLTQHRMVGRVAIEDKPDVLWDRPELERLYARLADEYELSERSRAIDRKLTARTLLELRTSGPCDWSGNQTGWSEEGVRSHFRHPGQRLS